MLRNPPTGEEALNFTTQIFAKKYWLEKGTAESHQCKMSGYHTTSYQSQWHQTEKRLTKKMHKNESAHLICGMESGNYR
jgi:hypothetical protein